MTHYYLFNKRESEEFMEVTFKVHSNMITHVETSFTLLDWILIDKLADSEISVDDIQEKEMKSLVYAILPGGNTLFHKLAEYDRVD